MPILILCADDFAMTRKISQSILALIEAGKLTATGAMTNRPAWTEFAGALVALGERADIGVHLNLTCGAPLGDLPSLAPAGLLPSLAGVLKGATKSATVRDEIAMEMARQLDAFEAHAGRQPDFIDGHQHVHAMPFIRDLLLNLVAKRYRPGEVWLRDPGDRVGAILKRGVEIQKALTVRALTKGFGTAAHAIGAPTNDSFAGFSAFAPERDFAADFRRFLVAPGERHLVMVHPGGEEDDELTGLDPVIGTRPIERDVLMNGGATRAIDEASLALGRFASTA